MAHSSLGEEGQGLEAIVALILAWDPKWSGEEKIESVGGRWLPALPLTVWLLPPACAVGKSEDANSKERGDQNQRFFLVRQRLVPLVGAIQQVVLDDAGLPHPVARSV